MLASNTSTPVLLAKVNCLEEFIKMSPIIEIPTQVRQEALFHEDSYYARLINKLIEEHGIKVVSVDNDEVAGIMEEFRLDEGEAATYVMFDNKKHDAILTDDGELIKLCKLRSIPFICAMAIVVRLYEKKKLSKEKAFIKLEELNEIGRYAREISEYFKGEIK